MLFLTIREFSKAPSAALTKLAPDGKAVLTNNGKPTAIVIPVNEESFERVFNLVQNDEKRGDPRIHYSTLSDEERAEVFERLMNYSKIKVPPDFDYKKELMEYRDERYGSTN